MHKTIDMSANWSPQQVLTILAFLDHLSSSLWCAYRTDIKRLNPNARMPQPLAETFYPLLESFDPANHTDETPESDW